MSTIVVSPSDVVTFPNGGGHFWVYMQYVQGLRQLGCEVFWLEHVSPSADPDEDAQRLSTFYDRMEQFGLAGKAILYRSRESGSGKPYETIGLGQSEAEAIFRRADLLLNFRYSTDPALLACFRCTALVDIDPGLLQFWMTTGQLRVPRHDLYFTIGETVGKPSATFSDCGLPWVRIRPPVCLELWPYVYDANCDAFTTVSGWWGGEWITDGEEVSYENNKRVSFLKFVELPRLTAQKLELALCLGEGWFGEEEHNDWQVTNPNLRHVSDYKGDAVERQVLENHGWQVRHADEVASAPQTYQSYIQRSRGEFSCAKPSCMAFRNAWISDRTVCYLASGKPVVIQNTGPSSFLPNGEGMFRFSTTEEAVTALETINADYEKHCSAARELAEAYFDAKAILGEILNTAAVWGDGAKEPMTR